jgi:hypothetical protein
MVRALCAPALEAYARARRQISRRERIDIEISLSLQCPEGRRMERSLVIPYNRLDRMDRIYRIYRMNRMTISRDRTDAEEKS